MSAPAFLSNDYRIDVALGRVPGVSVRTIEATNPNYLIIDSVNGVSPTSLSDLYDKLSALIA